MALKRKIFFLSLAVFGLILLGWSWVTRTTFEIASSRTGFNGIGVPVIETQLLLAWIAGILMLVFIALGTNRSERFPWKLQYKPKLFDLLIGLALWVTSIILWQSLPVEPNYFVNEPIPPNFEYYPSSDALYYDIFAQSHLVGEGFKSFKQSSVIRAPLALFFSILHIIGGQDYTAVVSIQVYFLALLPPLIYILASSIHNRVSGVIAAVLILLREANSIALGGAITASHAKLLLSDLPAQFMIVCLTIVVVSWLKRIEHDSAFPLLCGGFLGLTILLRMETAPLFLPLVVISGIILLKKKLPMLWLKNTLLLATGLVLVLSPWAWRNWQNTGNFNIDSPTMILTFLERRAQPYISAPQSPATPDDINQHILNAQAIIFPLTHYLNSQIQTFLILPTSFRVLDSFITFLGHKNLNTFWFRCCSTLNYIRRLPYWRHWDGIFPSQAAIPLLIVLMTIATGINGAWKKSRIIGLLPAFLSVSYILIHALMRNSGGRYILPVDWASILYFSIGLAEISSYIFFSLTHRKLEERMTGLSHILPKRSPERISILRSPKFYATMITIFLI